MALHSSLEDYALAYAINKCVKTNLQRSRKDLDMSQNISFPFFEWKDEFNHWYWTLITNNSSKEENLDRRDLFQNETSYTIHHLVPEYKDVDYFLKIEQDDSTMDDTIVKSILSIPEVITAYTIDTNKLKSKDNLIF